MGLVALLRRMVARALGMDLVIQTLSALAREVRRLSEEVAGCRCVEGSEGPVARGVRGATVVYTEIVVEAGEGAVRRLWGRDRVVLGGVVVTQMGGGLVRVAFKPSSSGRAREVLRVLGGRIRRVGVVLRIGREVGRG